IRNYAESQRYYELYLSKYPNDLTFRSAARAGIAACYENQGQYAEAASNFDMAYREFEKGPLAGDYLVSAMRNDLAAGNKEKAEEYLALLSEEFDGTTLYNRAARLFAEKTVQ
ncbi:MAG: hypothetical protein P1R58_02265, partial [bacterium]|nr:hypothetical protein [bacterium]